jgi:4-amino-4-deoxy-L-arabinose transferase-like glycosyltransferase
MKLRHATADNDTQCEKSGDPQHTHGRLPHFGRRTSAVEWLRQNSDAITIGAIVVATLAIRLVTIQHPGLAVTNWKEIDYISISRNFESHGFNIFTPQESWPAVPPRVTPMEFPLVPWAASILYALFGFSVYTVRILPVLAWLTLIVYVGAIAGRWGTSRVRRLAALFAAALPLWHPYGRVLFSDPFAVVASTAAIYHTQRWLDSHSRRQLILAGTCLSLAGLLKIECLWIGIPISWLVLSSSWRRDRRIAASAAIAGLVAAVPIVA